MQADQPPVIVAPSQADDPVDVIEVIGRRPDQAQKIDRRTYRVKQSPHSAQADTLQLLRGLPAVTIGPDDEILLLGASNVTVIIDDRPVQGSVTQYLKTLHGSDIERIEVITNPSAQYAPNGTGGIINIVLHRRQGDSVSGSAYGEASSLGSGNAGATWKYKQGRWRHEIDASANAGRTARSHYHLDRTIEAGPGARRTTSTEDGNGARFTSSAFLSAKVGREIDDRTSVYGKVFGGIIQSRASNDIALRGGTLDLRSFDEEQRQTGHANVLGFELGLDRKGAAEGERLKATASMFGNPIRNDRATSNLGEDGSFTIDRREPNRNIDVQVDWVHPIGKTQILSLGTRWFDEKHELRYRFINRSTDPSLGQDQADRFELRSATFSAYATFQQKIGRWALMPGLRVERYGRTVSSPGRTAFEVNRTQAFPTMHVERALSDRLDLALSYSKRIDRPGITQLRPFPIVTKVDAIENGNPALGHQSTEAYEINLHYHRKGLDAGLIVYARATSGLFSSRFSVDARGATVKTPINAGDRGDRGAEVDISAPLTRRIKASASVNLFDSRVPIDLLGGAATAHTFRYTGNATLEWNEPGRSGRPGDAAQFQITYASPRRAYQIRNSGSVLATLSYSHSVSRTLLLTATASGLGMTSSRQRLVAGVLREDLESSERGPEFKVKLVKTFGGSK